MPSTAPTRPLRSLSDDLRSRADSELAAVIRQRPDIAEPVPADIAELAARASTVPSARRAVDGLDRRSIQLLAVLTAQAQPVRPAELEEARSDPELLLEVVRSLWSRALLWGPMPTSLDVPIHVATAARNTSGEMPMRPLDLRRRQPHAADTLQLSALDPMAGQHALGSITAVMQVCDAWALRPPAVLKTGGLGVRDLAATAALLQTDEPTASFWIELAHAAGLLAPAEVSTRYFAPTNAYDGWISADLADQWTRLAIAWLRNERDAESVGALGTDQQRLAALGPGLEATGLTAVRHAILDMLSGVPAGSLIDADEVEVILGDRLPRVQSSLRKHAVRSLLREAEQLGVTARGALSSMGRVVNSGAVPDEIAAAARKMMPTPAEEFLAQADFTLVVPGPASPALRGLLNLVADVESTGGAAVYRVTPSSVARILDAGRTPAEVLQELASRSITALPQPLEYLVNDIARRHGTVRIGAVDSYIRSDDETVVAALLNHPRAAALGLVQVSPTVLVSRAPAQALLEIARDLGHAPVAEGADGSVVAVPRVVHRAPDILTSVDPGAGFDEVFVSALVRALRNAEQELDPTVQQSSRDPLPTTRDPVQRLATAQSVAILRNALLDGHPVWIGYADNAGSTTRRLVDIVAIEAGAISAFDHNSRRIRTLALSRVTGVERPTATAEQGLTSRPSD